MNALEVSLEILKIVISQENFNNNSDLSKKTDEILDLFKKIYNRVCEVKTETTLDGLNIRAEKLGEIHSKVLSMESLDKQARLSINKSISGYAIENCGSK